MVPMTTVIDGDEDDCNADGEQDQDSGKSLENAFLKIWMNNVKWKIFKKSFIKLKFLKERESEGDRRFSNGTY